MCIKSQQLIFVAALFLASLQAVSSFSWNCPDPEKVMKDYLEAKFGAVDVKLDRILVVVDSTSRGLSNVTASLAEQNFSFEEFKANVTRDLGLIKNDTATISGIVGKFFTSFGDAYGILMDLVSDIGYMKWNLVEMHRKVSDLHTKAFAMDSEWQSFCVVACLIIRVCVHLYVLGEKFYSNFTGDLGSAMCVWLAHAFLCLAVRFAPNAIIPEFVVPWTVTAVCCALILLRALQEVLLEREKAKAAQKKKADARKDTLDILIEALKRTSPTVVDETALRRQMAELYKDEPSTDEDQKNPQAVNSKFDFMKANGLGGPISAVPLSKGPEDPMADPPSPPSPPAEPMWPRILLGVFFLICCAVTLYFSAGASSGVVVLQRH